MHTCTVTHKPLIRIQERGTVFAVKSIFFEKYHCSIASKHPPPFLMILWFAYVYVQWVLRVDTHPVFSKHPWALTQNITVAGAQEMD